MTKAVVSKGWLPINNPSADKATIQADLEECKMQQKLNKRHRKTIKISINFANTDSTCRMTKSHPAKNSTYFARMRMHAE